MINSVTLVGRLTRDPELRYTPNGVAVATFTLAVNRTYTNQNGEREADFIQCVVWRKPAENVANYLSKGSLAGVKGRIQTRNYENNSGQRVYVTEVLVEEVSFLDSRKNGDRQSTADKGRSNQQQPYGNGAGYRYNDDPFADGEPIDISDDDLPF